MSGNPQTTVLPGAVIFTARALIDGGLAVTSAGDSALNGTYMCDPQHMQAVQAEANAILLNQTFADGSTTLAWPDKGGATHNFSVAQFHTLVVALSWFVAQCFLYGNGTVTSAPPATYTIA